MKTRKPTFVRTPLSSTPSACRRAPVAAAGLAACLAGLVVSIAPALAQCDTYTIGSSSAAFIPGVSDIGSHCDDCTTQVVPPFNISLFGNAYSTINVGSNGYIDFTTAHAFGFFTNACLPAPGALGPSLFVHWDDLLTNDVGGGIYTDVLGAAPNRTFVIEWRATYFVDDSPLNFEALFYEGQGYFDVVYASVSAAGGSATVGAQFSNTGPSVEHSCNAAVLAYGQAIRFNCASLTPGACCGTDGSCGMALQTACITPSTFSPGVCSPNPCPQPPSNDACAGGAVVALPYSYTGSIGGSEDTDVSCNDPAATGAQNGVWFTYTPGAAQLVRFTESTALNTVTSIFSGACDGLSEVRCSDPEDFVQTLNAGETYHILVSAYGAAPLPLGANLNFSMVEVQAPTNDTCATARLVPAGAYTDVVDGSTATNDADVSCNAASNVELRHGVWYRLDTTDPGLISLHERSANDVALAIFTGTCDGLTEVACTDAEAPAPAFNAAANTTYYILVGMWSAATVPGAPYDLTINFVPITGACCIAGNCTLTTQSGCAGSWGGPGSNCGGSTGFNFVPSANTFEDISASGALAAVASVCDDCGETIPLGFSFDYLGTSYTDVWVVSNGFIQFGAVHNNTFGNAPIPTAGVPNNFIAPLWDDFDLRVSGDIYYRLDGAPGSQRLIISWQGVGQFNAGDPPVDSNDFQVVLTEGSNAIEFRYQTISYEAAAGDYTIGYESADGLSGGSTPGSSVGGGNIALLLSNANPCPSGGVGACCGGSTCSATAPEACAGVNMSFSGVGTACNAAGNITTPCCKGDFNHDGSVSVLDIFAFLGGYFSQSPFADVNGVDGTSVVDIFDFLSLYFAGPC